MWEWSEAQHAKMVWWDKSDKPPTVGNEAEVINPFPTSLCRRSNQCNAKSLKSEPCILTRKGSISFHQFHLRVSSTIRWRVSTCYSTWYLRSQIGFQRVLYHPHVLTELCQRRLFSHVHLVPMKWVSTENSIPFAQNLQNSLGLCSICLRLIIWQTSKSRQ